MAIPGRRDAVDRIVAFMRKTPVDRRRPPTDTQMKAEAFNYFGKLLPPRTRRRRNPLGQVNRGGHGGRAASRGRIPGRARIRTTRASTTTSGVWRFGPRRLPRPRRRNEVGRRLPEARAGRQHEALAAFGGPDGVDLTPTEAEWLALRISPALTRRTVAQSASSVLVQTQLFDGAVRLEFWIRLDGPRGPGVLRRHRPRPPTAGCPSSGCA